jgi:putative DNA primase/helicase
MSNKRILARATPRRSAILFQQQERPNIINQQDEWLDWDGRAYVSVEQATIDSEIASWCDGAYQEYKEGSTGKKKTKPFDPKPGDVFAIQDSLKKKVHKPAGAFTAPCWLDGKGERRPKPSDLISLENGLLDITTRKLYPASPVFFNRTSLPIVYDPNAPVPKLWFKFLCEVFDNRQPLIDFLQELYGYTISGDTSQQTVVHLWGVTRGGKGTVLRILTDLVGEDNCHSPSIVELGGRFGLQGCLAKSLITITDMDTDNRSELGAAAVCINKISGEDRVSVERKGIDPWGGRLPGRIWIASNNLPDFGGHATAVAARLAMIPFDVSFLGREDHELTKKDGSGKLQRELPGILNWSLDGLARLRARGRFEEPTDSVKAKLRMLYASDPVRGFVTEKCLLDPAAAIDKVTLYPIYVEYCRTTGVHPLASNKFAEKLHSLYPVVGLSKRSAGDGSRPPIFSGIRLNDRELVKVFKVDSGMADLGLQPMHTLELDADGWPIVRRGYVADFAD